MTAILTDPELGGTTFTVERTTWQRAGGEAIPKATVQFEMTGCVHPGTPEQLEQEAKEAALKQAQAQEETIAEAFEPKEEKPDQTEDGTFLKPTSETGGTLRLEEIDEDEDEAWKASKPSEENGEKTDELF